MDMAYPSTLRPLSNGKAQPWSNSMTTADVSKPSFGSSTQAWGASNVWKNGSLTNGFNSRAATRDNSASRAASQQNVGEAAEIVEGKTGSSSLADSSVSNAWGYRTSWGAKRSLPSARPSSQAKYNETSTPQQRSVSDAMALKSVLSAGSQNTAPVLSRPPTINLTSTSSASARPSYGSAFSGSFSGRGSERPPNIYTKFDRPSDPSTSKYPDSAKVDIWSQPSPTEQRNGQFGLHDGGRNSLSSSRHGSQPPSRNGNERPYFSNPDYACPAQRQNYSNSRTPSLSSHGNSSHGPPFTPNTDQLVYQLDQLTFKASSRPPSSYRSPNTFRSGDNLPSPFSPTAMFSPEFTGLGSSILTADDAQAGGSVNLNGLDFDDYSSTLRPSDCRGFGNPTFNSRFLQTPLAGDARPSQAHLNSPNGVSGYDTLPGAGPDIGWPISGNASAPPRNLGGLPEQPTYFDPRMQQLIDSHVRNGYNAIYNPYALPNPLGVDSTAPFVSFMPANIRNLAQINGSLDLPDVEKVQSTLMFDFKTNNKSKRYELKDIYDHIAEFSGDQHGSRFIQTKLETANSDEKERVFREIEPNAIPLMTDVFGNYVIQKFFEHGDQTHKKILANKMRGQVLNLSLQMYGCRVVQKALDHVLVDQQAQLVSELEGSVLRCVKDQNGNHVIQKAIERCPPTTIGFIIAAFQGQVHHLSINSFGCRVIQRCLEYCEPHLKTMIMRELMDSIHNMVTDQYGNYVVQHIVVHDNGEAKAQVLNIVGQGLESYSKHKFASNVVEKCLEKADDQWRRGIVCMLAREDHRRCEGEGVLVGLIKDNFGNYVIQKLLDTLCPEDYCHFIDVLQPAMTLAKRTGCGKQVLSIEKKMHRFAPFHGSFSPAVYQMPLPPPPFPGTCHSTATTPPPLTADTQSLQSSALPSINGDTVEGAALSSRKGSELSNDGHYVR